MKVLTLEEVLDRNSDWIVPTSWKNESDPRTGEPLSVAGADIIRKRLVEMHRANLELRAETLEKCRSDPAFQAEELKKCAEDFIYWLTRYGWIFNANERQFVPFLPFEAQVRKILYPWYHDTCEPLASREDRRDQMIMKSRYMGATFCFLMGGLWGALFHSYWDGGTPYVVTYGANKLDKLDKRGNPDTHFGRLWLVMQTIYEQAPWMIPEMSAGRKVRTYLQISLPGRMSVLTGEAVNENFGRSGRSTAAVLDEEAFATGACLAMTGLTDNTSVIRRLTTVNGFDPSFMVSWRNRDLKIEKTKFHWSDCPWYDQKWFEAECSHRDKVSIAQELECDPEASAEGRYWEEFKPSVNVVPDSACRVVPHTPVYVCVDPGCADGTALTFWQVDEEQGHFICHGYIYRRPAKLDAMVPFLLGRVPEKDLLGKVYSPDWRIWGPQEQTEVARLGEVMRQAGSVIYVGGSDMAQNTLTSDSVAEIMLRQWDIPVYMIRITDKLEAIRRVARMVHYIRIPQSVADRKVAGCEHTIVDVFCQYRAAERKNPLQSDKTLKPLHNEFSNGADSIQYFAAQVALLMPVMSEKEKARGVKEPVQTTVGLEKMRELAAKVYGGK